MKFSNSQFPTEITFCKMLWPMFLSKQAPIRQDPIQHLQKKNLDYCLTVKNFQTATTLIHTTLQKTVGDIIHFERDQNFQYSVRYRDYSL
jgi:hypothetical protein